MRIAVLTSGGDAPGMNPAVRGVVRRALLAGAEVVGVHEGYAGLVDGGERMPLLQSADVANILHLGGTTLGTARSAAFRELEGRRRAVRHLLEHEVSRLVVVGGDGSLTGAYVLRKEWDDHVAALVAEGVVTPERAAEHPALRIVGLVGSIDNDMWGTDTTIGYDSALHRIVEAVDALSATARSHQRAFVVEVMGRHCGYLALAAAVCTGADEVLVPEAPAENWQGRLVDRLRAARQRGNRKSIVLVAEGAVDRAGERITAADVKAVIDAELGYDTRITVLGHVQRGGGPSAFDRITSSILGVRAAEALLAMGDDAEPVLMTTEGTTVRPRPLMACVERTQQTARFIGEGRFEEAADSRGEGFEELVDLHHTTSHPRPVQATGKRLLLVHLGAPAPGMNPAIRAFVRTALQHGHTPLLASNGMRGLMDGEVTEANWGMVHNISGLGATVLGTHRWVPRGWAELAPVLANHRVDGVAVVGGYEALSTVHAIGQLGVPAIVVPATISNNVPGTELAIGVDTALNAIVEAVDRLKQSAIGSRDRVFFVEVMGRRCGHLAIVGAVGSGAELVYTHEGTTHLATLGDDLRKLNQSFDEGRNVGIVLVADGATSAYDAAALARIFAVEADGRFDTRVCVLGHLQQGGPPSPADRLLGARYAARAVRWLADHDAGSVIVGLRDGQIGTLSTALALALADDTNRRPTGDTAPEASRLVQLLGLGRNAAG